MDEQVVRLKDIVIPSINELSFSFKSARTKESFIRDLFVKSRSKAYDNRKFPVD